VPGIISRLIGGGKLTVAQKHQLVIDGMSMYAQGRSPQQVENTLRERGVSAAIARETTEDALQRYEAEVVRKVPLPASARSGINYYFLLGLTPNASTDQIRRAYRRKALAVHPDQHHSEFTREWWSNLMTTIGDAERVLTHERTRRAYDVVWRRRSRAIAEENRRKGELRGDWESRYRWDIAELAEMEEQISVLLEQLQQALAGGADGGGMVPALATALENYETRLLDIRNQSYTLGGQFEWLAEQVRQETQRKDKLVGELRRVAAWLPEAQSRAGAVALAPKLDETIRVLGIVRSGQQQFDIRSAR
jgi:hypothetical protein